MKEQVGTDYDDREAIYVVGTSPFEEIEQLEADREEKGLPWPVAYAEEGMLEALNISRQASKIAIGGDGTITHRYGTGRGDYDSWDALFDDISVN
jgi:hypothetical protein